MASAHRVAQHPKLPSIRDLDFQYQRRPSAQESSPVSALVNSTTPVESPRDSSARNVQWARPTQATSLPQAMPAPHQQHAHHHHHHQQQQQPTPPLSANHEVKHYDSAGYLTPGMPLSAQTTPVPGSITTGPAMRSDDPPHAQGQKRPRTSSASTISPREGRPSQSYYPPQYAAYSSPQPPPTSPYHQIPPAHVQPSTHHATPPPHEQIHHPGPVTAHPGYSSYPQQQYLHSRQDVHPQQQSQVPLHNPYPSPGPPPSVPPPQDPWAQHHQQQQYQRYQPPPPQPQQPQQQPPPQLPPPPPPPPASHHPQYSAHPPYPPHAHPHPQQQPPPPQPQVHPPPPPQHHQQQPQQHQHQHQQHQHQQPQPQPQPQHPPPPPPSQQPYPPAQPQPQPHQQHLQQAPPPQQPLQHQQHPHHPHAQPPAPFVARTTPLVPTTVDTRTQSHYAPDVSSEKSSHRSHALAEIMSHCTVLHSFASRYAQLQVSLPQAHPAPAEIVDMSNRANAIVRLVEDLRRMGLSDNDMSPKVEGAGTTPVEDGTRLPKKRPWEDMALGDGGGGTNGAEGGAFQEYSTNTPASPSSTAESKPHPQTTAEQDMEIIRSKRATSSAGGVSTIGQPKSKYRKRSRATPPGKCHSCYVRETPEWRRGPDGARTLCNACGLHYAKLVRKRVKIHGADAAASIDMETLRASAKADLEKTSGRANKSPANNNNKKSGSSSSTEPPPPQQHHQGSFQLVVNMIPAGPPPPPPSTDVQEQQMQGATQPAWHASTSSSPAIRGYVPEQPQQQQHLQHQSFIRTSQPAGQASPR